MGWFVNQLIKKFWPYTEMFHYWQDDDSMAAVLQSMEKATDTEEEGTEGHGEETTEGDVEDNTEDKGLDLEEMEDAEE